MHTHTDDLKFSKVEISGTAGLDGKVILHIITTSDISKMGVILLCFRSSPCRSDHSQWRLLIQNMKGCCRIMWHKWSLESQRHSKRRWGKEARGQGNRNFQKKLMIGIHCAKNRNDLPREPRASYCVVCYKQDATAALGPWALLHLVLMGPLVLEPAQWLASDTLSAGLLLDPRFLKLRIITSSRRTGSQGKRCQDNIPRRSPNWNPGPKRRLWWIIGIRIIKLCFDQWGYLKE